MSGCAGWAIRQPRTTTTHRGVDLTKPNESISAESYARASQKLLRGSCPIPPVGQRHRRQHPFSLRRYPEEVCISLRLASRRGVLVQGHSQAASASRWSAHRSPHSRPRAVGGEGHRRRSAKGDQVQSSARLPTHQHPLPVTHPSRPLSGQPHRARLRPRQGRKPDRNSPAFFRLSRPQHSGLGRGRHQVRRQDSRPRSRRHYHPRSRRQEESRLPRELPVLRGTLPPVHQSRPHRRRHPQDARPTSAY